jgi:AraC-like DNA-binding protein/ligand-binding sensor protein
MVWPTPPIEPPLGLPEIDFSGMDGELVERLQGSAIYRDYQRAFEAATGLPLAIRVVGSFQPPLHGSKMANPFCLLMAASSRSCAACLRLQERIEAEAGAGPATFNCFAGLSDSAVPIHVGERVVAFLQTGQVLLRKPTERQFQHTLRQLEKWDIVIDPKPLKVAYFRTRVVTRRRYQSILSLLAIFSQHLSMLSHQIMMKTAAAEIPAITKARAFIAEHQGDEISLAEVARTVNMSAFYFCKVFKKATGLTYTEYLARIRVEAVKRLLLDPHKRVSEAAYEAGFQSLSQFNRVFHRLAGETPSLYRERSNQPAGSRSMARRLGRAA